MPTPRESFLAHVRSPDADETVIELRHKLTRLKLDALEQSLRVDNNTLARIMVDLYERLARELTQLAGHVGLGVALALSVIDEHHSGASLSVFSREQRDSMNETSLALTRRHGSRIATWVAEISAHRLAWCNSHEFMSWLAFRRGDERYPAQDRLERLCAFGVQAGLLEARQRVVDLLGVHLSAAIESADRFFLTNRWRLSNTPEHALERYVWPLLSYLPATTVRLERQRWEYDCTVERGASETDLEAAKAKLAGLLEAQLTEALDQLAPTAFAGHLQAHS